MFGVQGDEPDVVLRDNVGSPWLGRWTVKVRVNSSDRPVIEIQRRVLSDPRTLERVIAHEVVHHVDYLNMDPSDLELLKIGIRLPAHGDSFRHLASIVNARMGEGFVTEKSDKEYVVAPSGRRILLLIAPASHGRLGWQWATRLGPKALEWVQRRTAEDARLVEAVDDRWTYGPRIEAWKGWAIPPDEETANMLRELYEGPQVSV
jgi:hypothetical protein